MERAAGGESTNPTGVKPSRGLHFPPRGTGFMPVPFFCAGDRHLPPAVTRARPYFFCKRAHWSRIVTVRLKIKRCGALSGSTQK